MIARTKPKPHMSRTSQGFFLAAGGCLLIAVIVMSSYFGPWHSWRPNSSSGLEIDTTDFVRTQVGTLVLRGPGDACRAYRYDNLTGETFPASGPCEITAQIDRRIMGEPGGDTRQLESVSKYFLRH